MPCAPNRLLQTKTDNFANSCYSESPFVVVDPKKEKFKDLAAELSNFFLVKGCHDLTKEQNDLLCHLMADLKINNFNSQRNIKLYSGLINKIETAIASNFQASLQQCQNTLDSVEEASSIVHQTFDETRKIQSNASDQIQELSQIAGELVVRSAALTERSISIAVRLPSTPNLQFIQVEKENTKGMLEDSKQVGKHSPSHAVKAAIEDCTKSAEAFQEHIKEAEEHVSQFDSLAEQIASECRELEQMQEEYRRNRTAALEKRKKRDFTDMLQPVQACFDKEQNLATESHEATKPLREANQYAIILKARLTQFKHIPTDFSFSFVILPPLMLNQIIHISARWLHVFGIL